jgi:hypothetical protein
MRGALGKLAAQEKLMESKQLGEALVGMERALASPWEDPANAVDELAKTGGAQVGGFMAGMALGMGERGSFDAVAVRAAAELACRARKLLSGRAEEELDFLFWLRGGLAAASKKQGQHTLELGRAFASVYQEGGRDEWLDLLMTQPFFSTQERPNACDMASIVEALGAKARKGSM